ncbi:hypothetical protein GQ457_10G011820 [Hibiscus cannabinus]
MSLILSLHGNMIRGVCCGIGCRGIGCQAIFLSLMIYLDFAVIVSSVSSGSMSSSSAEVCTFLPCRDRGLYRSFVHLVGGLGLLAFFATSCCYGFAVLIFFLLSDFSIAGQSSRRSCVQDLRKLPDLCLSRLQDPKTLIVPPKFSSLSFVRRLFPLLGKSGSAIFGLFGKEFPNLFALKFIRVNYVEVEMILSKRGTKEFVSWLDDLIEELCIST